MEPTSHLIVVCVLLASLTGCGGMSTPAAGSILDSAVQATTLDQLKQAIDDLHTHHPDVIARQLYWYALAEKSDDSKKVFTDLLQSRGIK